MMKRARVGDQEGPCLVDASMAHVLMLLSKGFSGGFADHLSAAVAEQHPAGGNGTGRVFECKTCSRQFPSFQALGGHRASHKKPRLLDDQQQQQEPRAAKPRVHECSICGLEFTLGQALGGHMRRHRVTTEGVLLAHGAAPRASTTTEDQESAVSDGAGSGDKLRIFGIDLELNVKAVPLEADSDPRFLALSLGPPIVH